LLGKKINNSDVLYLSKTFAAGDTLFKGINYLSALKPHPFLLCNKGCFIDEEGFNVHLITELP
jgi:hypothetical protein